MHMTNDRLIASQRHIQRTIIDGVVPHLVETEPDVHRLERRNRRAILRIEIANESTGRNSMLAHAAFEEISSYRAFREKRDVRSRSQGIELREDPAKPGEISVVVAFSRLELNDCKVH